MLVSLQLKQLNTSDYSKFNIFYVNISEKIASDAMEQVFSYRVIYSHRR